MMRRILSVLILLVVSATGVAAQETFVTQRPYDVNRGFLRLGAGVFFEMEGTTNDAFEFRMRVDPTVDVTWILPASAGSAGTQLQTSGGTGEQLSWASAGSKRDYKTIDGLMSPQDALAAILKAPIYRFHYKNSPSAITTGDYATQYVGIVADDAPWAMHFNGTILNPVNTVGYAFGAIQALEAQVKALEAMVKDLAEKLAQQVR